MIHDTPCHFNALDTHLVLSFFFAHVLTIWTETNVFMHARIYGPTNCLKVAVESEQNPLACAHGFAFMPASQYLAEAHALDVTHVSVTDSMFRLRDEPHCHHL